MVMYRYSKCPYCGYRLESGEPTGINDYASEIGEEFETCPKCNEIYKTGKQKWENMSSAQKHSIYFQVIFTIFYSGIFYGCLGVVAIYAIFTYFLKKELNDSAIIVFSLISLIFSYAFSIHKNHKTFKDLTKRENDDAF